MRRREFITLLGATAAWPRVGRAQQSKIWRLGWLHPSFGISKLSDAFAREIRGLGFEEGQNLVVDRRFAQGRFERLPALAEELVALKPDVIVAIATPAIAAAQRATPAIPIVMCPATDPIGSGFVKSLANPGGNITGVANMFGDVVGKGVELLHALVPEAKKIAVLLSLNPTHPAQYIEVQTACLSLGISTIAVTAPTSADLPGAFREIAEAGCDALFVAADPVRPNIVPMATDAKIPAMYQFREFVEAGGLVSYGASTSAMFKKAAHYVGRIFKGANPSELPVEQPTEFELVINLKAAKALGMTVPPLLLARADEVIE
jgi:putative ABC transport system substrate-binding protein